MATLGGIMSEKTLFAVHPEVFRTEKGTPYLKEPGAVLLAKPEVNYRDLKGFLEGFDAELGFQEYLTDPDDLPPAEKLCKAAGQLCYMSFGPKRTKNGQAKKYFENLIGSGHGSVLEHANFTFLFYGISRSVTHELVRHRAGFGFSQVSQRYVSGKVLRFVERPEYQQDSVLHEWFTEMIDKAAKEYARRTERLLLLQQEGNEILGAEAKTDLRKKVQQAARSCLPNETEAPIVVTANVRAWRHVIEMRANPHAETEIRELLFRTFAILRESAPILFGDYTIEYFSDGTKGVKTEWHKV